MIMGLAPLQAIAPFGGEHRGRVFRTHIRVASGRSEERCGQRFQWTLYT